MAWPVGVAGKRAGPDRREAIEIRTPSFARAEITSKIRGEQGRLEILGSKNIFDFFDDGSETVLRSVPPIGTDGGGGDHVCGFRVLSPLFAELHPLHIQEPTLPASSSTVAFDPKRSAPGQAGKG